jgi:hypothetical protein
MIAATNNPAIISLMWKRGILCSVASDAEPKKTRAVSDIVPVA